VLPLLLFLVVAGDFAGILEGLLHQPPSGRLFSAIFSNTVATEHTSIFIATSILVDAGATNVVVDSRTFSRSVHIRNR
jgi:hypothetical protein